MERTDGTTVPVSPEITETVARLAGQALAAVATLDTDARDRALLPLFGEYAEYLAGAFYTWCHIATEAANRLLGEQAALELLGEVINPPPDDPTIAWSAQMFAAYLHTDEDASRACIEAINDMAAEEATANIYLLLSACAAVTVTAAAHRKADRQ